MIENKTGTGETGSSGSVFRGFERGSGGEGTFSGRRLALQNILLCAHLVPLLAHYPLLLPRLPSSATPKRNFCVPPPSRLSFPLPLFFRMRRPCSEIPESAMPSECPSTTTTSGFAAPTAPPQRHHHHHHRHHRRNSCPLRAPRCHRLYRGHPPTKGWGAPQPEAGGGGVPARRRGRRGVVTGAGRMSPGTVRGRVRRFQSRLLVRLPARG